MLHLYETGAVYDSEKVHGRDDGPALYHYRIGAHELLLRAGTLSDTQRTSVLNGPCEFAVVAQEDAVFLLYRFGGGSDDGVTWSVAAPFSIWQVNRSERVLPGPPLTPGEREDLQVVVLEAGTGVVEATRAVLLPADVSAALNRAITAQAEGVWPGTHHFDAACERVRARFPRPDDLLTVAAARGSAQ